MPIPNAIAFCELDHSPCAIHSGHGVDGWAYVVVTMDSPSRYCVHAHLERTSPCAKMVMLRECLDVLLVEPKLLPECRNLLHGSDLALCLQMLVGHDVRKLRHLVLLSQVERAQHAHTLADNN